MAREKGRPHRRIHLICRQLNVAVRNGQDETARTLAAMIIKQNRATMAHLHMALTPETRQFIAQSPMGAYL